MALYHSAKGSVDYTIVGTPTIVDGVVSDFSANNYLQLPNLPESITSFHLHTVATINSQPSSPAGIFMINGYPSLEFQGAGVFRAYTTTSGGTAEAHGYIGSAISYGTKVEVDCYFENGTTRFVATQGGVTKLDVSYSDTKIASSYITFGRYWNPLSNGSIDLNNTYIKVNGQPWFGICPIEVKKHQIMGPVGYTVVGSPTITDGVASGFSASDYLQISQTYNATNDKNVEIYVRAKTPTTITSSFNPIFGADNIGYWGISSYTNALFTIRMGYSNGTTLTFGDMYISGGIQADTWYRFKIKGSNGIWRAEIYNDSGTLLNSSDRDWTSNTLSENYTIKLKCTDNTGVYSGAIDLNNTYIKVNGKLWFWQPRETERIIVNGVEVWTKPVITHGYTLTATRGTYAYTSQTFDLHNASSWSYNTRYKYLVAGQAGGQWLFGNSNGYYTGPMLLITSQNHLSTYLSSTGSGFNIAQEKQLTDMTFEVNKEYLISLLYTDVDGYNFKVTDIASGHIYNFNVSTNTAHINNTAPTYFMNNMGGLTNSYNQGIMYLADTSIIVDGAKVFDGATAEIGVDLINNGLTIGEE